VAVLGLSSAAPHKKEISLPRQYRRSISMAPRRPARLCALRFCQSLKDDPHENRGSTRMWRAALRSFLQVADRVA
jgi:hypothetical protein